MLSVEGLFTTPYNRAQPTNGDLGTFESLGPLGSPAKTETTSGKLLRTVNKGRSAQDEVCVVHPSLIHSILKGKKTPQELHLLQNAVSQKSPEGNSTRLQNDIRKAPAASATASAVLLRVSQRLEML